MHARTHVLLFLSTNWFNSRTRFLLRPVCHTHTHTHTHPHPHTHTPHTPTHARTPTHPHPHTPSLNQSLTDSLTHSLTHWLARSPTHAPPTHRSARRHAHTHSLTHELEGQKSPKAHNVWVSFRRCELQPHHRPVSGKRQLMIERRTDGQKGHAQRWQGCTVIAPQRQFRQ